MRLIQAALLLAFLGAVVVFAVQNNNTASVRFLAWGFSTPFPALIVGVYILGMFSGGALLGFLRRSIRRVSERPESPGR